MHVITHRGRTTHRHSVEPATVVARIQQLISEAEGNVVITFDPLRLQVMNEETGEELVIQNATDPAGFRRAWLSLSATVRRRKGRCIDPQGHPARNFAVKGDGMVNLSDCAVPEPELTPESVDNGWTLMHTDEQWDDSGTASSPTPHATSATDDANIDDNWELPSRAA